MKLWFDAPHRSCCSWRSLRIRLAAEVSGGSVRSRGLPIPGATVTAVQGDRKVVTATDVSGRFTLPGLAPGSWTVTVEMTGFSPASKTIECRGRTGRD